MYPDRDYYKPAGFGGFTFFPPVIKNLLLINAVVFLVNNLLLSNITVSGLPAEVIITKYFALIPLKGLLLGTTPVGDVLTAVFYPWQLVTYQFLHKDFMHIFFNMFALWMFGMEIENLWGSKKFLIYYLACGIGGGLLHLILAPMMMMGGALTIGASGAIFGVMVAFAMMFPDRYIYIYFLIPIKAKYLIAFLIVIEFLSAGSMDVVAHLVHIGGALVGFAYILFDSKSNVKISGIFDSFRKSPGSGGRSPSPPQFRKKPFSFRNNPVEDANFFEIHPKDEKNVTQEEIDRILDKISQSGYQNLTDKEKKILFEASKKG